MVDKPFHSYLGVKVMERPANANDKFPVTPYIIDRLATLQSQILRIGLAEAIGLVPTKEIFDYCQDLRNMVYQYGFMTADEFNRPQLPNTTNELPRKSMISQQQDANMLYETHGLDTQNAVYFYEQDFYVLSNFSSFRVEINDVDFDTAEHAYHYAKFGRDPEISNDVRDIGQCNKIRDDILYARSAHEAFKIARANKHLYRPDWEMVKIPIMEIILIHKVEQHEYVAKKLEATGNRYLVENSWRDEYWGWGKNGDGQNILGKLWTKIRNSRRAVSIAEATIND